MVWRRWDVIDVPVVVVAKEIVGVNDEIRADTCFLLTGNICLQVSWLVDASFRQIIEETFEMRKQSSLVAGTTLDRKSQCCHVMACLVAWIHRSR